MTLTFDEAMIQNQTLTWPFDECLNQLDYKAIYRPAAYDDVHYLLSAMLFLIAAYTLWEDRKMSLWMITGAGICITVFIVKNMFL